MALDLNRGVMTKFHPSGIKVNMYLDDPGTYLDDRGQPLDEKFAIQAGFNVERDKREKLKQLKLKAYKEQLDREMQSEEEALAEAMSQSGKVDVRHIGGGQFAIFDKTGARMTKVAMTRADVEALIGPIDKIAGEEHAPTTEVSSRSSGGPSYADVAEAE